MKNDDKILVIEDDDSLREVLVEVINNEGYPVLAAADGVEGVEVALHDPPSLIVCDVVMPRLDGYGVLSRLRQAQATALTPFIFLTGLSDEADFRDGMNGGADDYLVKPVSQTALIEAIKAHLARQAEIRELTLRRLDEVRSTVTRALPHEFLTPLTAVLGLSSFLMDEVPHLDADDVKNVARQIHEGGRRLQELSEKFLLYVELAAMSREPGRVSELRSQAPRAVAALLETAARDHARLLGRETDLAFQLEAPHLATTKEHWQGIVSELTDNACRFSTAGTPISLRLVQQGESVVFSITDQGRGMTAEQIARVGALVQFDRRRFEQPGTGLGLAIVHQYALLYGGEMSIASEAGHGTTVRIVLPLSAA
jgi:two-component system, sensor histidine kinase and response regulator